ncbi:MAG TPA: hypothetical protein VK921_16075 [Anditalea sp.]|nr:hypothetical protein [Anditalea sp.]
MKRRKFISVGISLAGLPLIYFPLAGCSSSEDQYPLPQEFLPEEIIHSIGIAYMKMNPNFDQDSVASLSLKQLTRKVKEDFEKDITIVVAGWVLSKTEAQHCAITYLQNR